jgi:hypothetical protein
MSVSLRASSNITYVNVPVKLYVDVDVGFEPTLWDVNNSYNDVVVETYKGGSLYSRKVYSFPLELGKRYYSWAVDWSVPDPDTYSVKAGWRLLYIPSPYGYSEYVWSAPITVTVQSPTAPPTPPPTAPYSSVGLQIPDSVSVGEEFQWKVIGQLRSTPNWPNFAVCIKYSEGPADYVILYTDSKEYKVSKGSGIYITKSPPPPPGSYLEFSGKGKLEVPGKYVFKGSAGYVKDNVFYTDSEVSKTVEAKSLTAGIPWWYIALPLAGVGIVGVVALIAYQEMRREEMMWMLLLGR